MRHRPSPSTSWSASGLRLFQLSLLAILVALSSSCGRRPAPKTYFPETGRAAVYQRSLDLQNDLNVLSIALQPGYEDLATLAYFRLGRGARIMSAYVTNGEAGESDVRAEYPPYLAAVRRQEAAKALSYLDGELYFLNLPDIAAARDSAWIRMRWPSDSLQARLRDLVDRFQPDLVLVAPDWPGAGSSLRQAVLISDLLTVIRDFAPAEPPRRPTASDSHTGRPVQRVLVEETRGSAISAPVLQRHPIWKKTYRTIGEEAARAYVSLAVQRRSWGRDGGSSYRVIYPTPAPRLQAIDAGLAAPGTPRLRWIEDQIHDLTAPTLRGKSRGAVQRIVTVLDSIGVRLSQRYLLRPLELRKLLRWKRGLEDLRSALIGVRAEVSLSDSTLTASQLTYLTVDKVEGMGGDGKTSIYFGGVDVNWVVNEGFEKRFPLKLGEPYRLLTPRNVSFDTPHALYGLERSDLDANLIFFIIHRASPRWKSFVYRRTVRVRFAPRFVTEVLTPLIRMVPGERIIVRLTNYSRDGVADKVVVDDSLATSNPGPFRLSHKGATQVDTLWIQWQISPEEGTYLIPVKINGLTVARFAARKFDVAVDTTKRVGVVAALANSPILDALRRLNVHFSKIDPGRRLQQEISDLDVVIIDRRALTLRPELTENQADLEQFVARGGHLIVLAQDAEVWNAHPLWAGLQLTPTQSLDEQVPLAMDEGHEFVSQPNPLSNDDWENWLYLRAYHRISGKALQSATAPIRTEADGEPLVVTMAHGQGRQTYIDLALAPQLLNIHAGAFRLLANLISYGP